MTAAVDPRSHFSILPVEGALRAPLSANLRRRVEALLGRGQRQVVLDLADVSDIDAAGIGELVRAFTTMKAAGGVLQIAHASRRVRKLLHVTGVLTLLNRGADRR
jgi:anti-sigma B factor antagonist